MYKLIDNHMPFKKGSLLLNREGSIMTTPLKEITKNYPFANGNWYVYPDIEPVILFYLGYYLCNDSEWHHFFILNGEMAFLTFPAISYPNYSHCEAMGNLFQEATIEEYKKREEKAKYVEVYEYYG